MKAPIIVRRPNWLLAAGVVLLLLAGVAAAGNPIVAGYSDYDAYRRQLESIAASELARLESLGRTAGGREIYLLRIGTGNLDNKPAVMIVGGIHPPHLLGSELATRLARRLVDRADKGKRPGKMLKRVTFYVIPRAAPDPCEAFFRRPYCERAGNDRPTDDDRDGRLDEDGPEDLNGDGLITMMRVEDPAGAYRPHPRDARVLIKADPQKNERGRWSLYIEGRDNDEDETWNEDPPGGVAFNRNFPFRYPYFGVRAGPYQVSEAEAKAVADFAFSHPNIAVVLSFTPEDNLMRPWKPDPSAESKRIKTALLPADAGYLKYVAQQYQRIHGGNNPPRTDKGQGSFSEWAYFHYGRWSLACRGWWIPRSGPAEEEKENDERKEKGKEQKQQQSEGKEKTKDEAKQKTDKSKPSDKKRGADELDALRWFAEQQIDGFVDWKRIKHPDFPGRKVEVGGFRPFVRLNPPADRLDPLADRHWRFLRRLIGLLPRVVIGETEAEALGGGVWRVRAVVLNKGYLPTVSKMGETARQGQPLQIELELPRGCSLVTGHARVQLASLAGRGGKAEQTWLVLVGEPAPALLGLKVWSPSVGRAEKHVRLRPNKKKK